jgi:hypothetical protein
LDWIFSSAFSREAFSWESKEYTSRTLPNALRLFVQAFADLSFGPCEDFGYHLEQYKDDPSRDRELRV